MTLFLILTLSLLLPMKVEAKKVKYRKTQEVSFDGDDIEGVKRNPYGAYLVQKRGVDFAPLYNIREKFEANIKAAHEYVK